MRIGLDASVASMRGSGSGRYAADLVPALLALDREGDYVLYFRERDRGVNPLLRLGGPRVRARFTDAPLTLLRVHANLPLWLRRDRIDLYHSLGYFLPWAWRGPSVVTMHDIHPALLSQHWWRPGTRVSFLALRAHIPLSLARARRVLVPSEYTGRCLQERFGTPAHRIVVAPLGLDPFFRSEPERAEMEEAARRFGRDDFFLFVGALAPLKNLDGTVQALARLHRRLEKAPRLLVVGQPWGAFHRHVLAPLVERLGLTQAVHFAGYVEDTLLRALYRRALALVLPSFGEGFGFPVLEAMGCGTPVITSNVSALPELAGDAALLVDPRDHDTLARAMETLATDAALRHELGERGRRRAETFTWERTARATLRAYREAAAPQ